MRQMDVSLPFLSLQSDLLPTQDQVFPLAAEASSGPCPPRQAGPGRPGASPPANPSSPPPQAGPAPPPPGPLRRPGCVSAHHDVFAAAAGASRLAPASPAASPHADQSSPRRPRAGRAPPWLRLRPPQRLRRRRKQAPARRGERARGPCGPCPLLRAAPGAALRTAGICPPQRAAWRGGSVSSPLALWPGLGAARPAQPGPARPGICALSNALAHLS